MRLGAFKDCIEEKAEELQLQVSVEGVWWQFQHKNTKLGEQAASRAIIVTSPTTQTITKSLTETLQLTEEEVTERAEDKLRLRTLARPSRR